MPTTQSPAQPDLASAEDRLYQFASAIVDATRTASVSQLQRRLGISYSHAGRLVERMVREGVEQGSGIFGMFQTKKKGYEIATDPDIKPGASFVAKRYDDIPVLVRDKLAQEVRDRYKLGTKPLTTAQKDEIERMYTTGTSQGRF